MKQIEVISEELTREGTFKMFKDFKKKMQELHFLSSDGVHFLEKATGKTIAYNDKEISLIETNNDSSSVSIFEINDDDDFSDFETMLDYYIK
jgi:virulence-associated protein VapD